MKEDFVKEFSQHVHDYANELSVYVYELRVGENELEQSAQSCVLKLEVNMSSHTECLISNTDVYDVLLGMEFMGQTFGYVHPLTCEYIWYTDCKEFRNDHMPTATARLPINLRGAPRERRYVFMSGEITCADDLLHAVEGDEDEPMVIDPIPLVDTDLPMIAMAGAATDPAPMLVSPTFSDAERYQSQLASVTRQRDTTRNVEAAARLHA